MGMSNLGRNLFSFPNLSRAVYESFKRFEDGPLTAISNIQYLEFTELVQSLWAQGHPDIPVVPLQTGTYAKYPCIVYALESRFPDSNEKKARLRNPSDVLKKEFPNVTVFGQKFHNIISFSVLTRAKNADILTDENPAYRGAEVADRIIETFEDFMFEYVPVFKAFGISEFQYFRRIPDVELNRDSIDVNKRTVTYLLITEKLTVIDNDVINKITLDIRTYLAYERAQLRQLGNDLATPNFENIDLNVIDLFQSATPNY